MQLTNEIALDISLSRVSRLASANHDSERELVLDNTLCVCCTRRDSEAWIVALSVKAGFFAQAVSISRASSLFNHWLRD